LRPTFTNNRVCGIAQTVCDYFVFYFMFVFGFGFLFLVLVFCFWFCNKKAFYI